MPTISIIVPVYNVEKHLDRCVESILAQTFTDFELILVDDGSPDSCPKICDKYALKDNRIVVIHKLNGGVSSARNAGICAARGKYVMFCDSDDCVHQDWCKQLYDQIVVNPNAWIVSNISKVYENQSVSLSCANLIKDNLSYNDIFVASLSAYCINKIHSLDVIKKYSIFFDESRKIGEDVLFNIQYYSHCDKIIYLSEPLYYYYDTPTSAMNTFRNDQFSINLELFDARLPLIKEHELNSFCNTYFYMFLQWLDNTMDKRNKMGLIAKMRYNHKMMNTDEFKYCVEHASGEKESPLFMKVVRKHNYYLYWLFQKATNFKQKFRKK